MTRWFTLLPLIISLLFASHSYAKPETRTLRMARKAVTLYPEPHWWQYSLTTPTGLFIAQDKSKGIIWLLNLDTGIAGVIELPFNSGNHETGVNYQSRTLFVPHYEDIRAGDAEGQGKPGSEIAVVNINAGHSRIMVSKPILDEGTKQNSDKQDLLMFPKPHDAIILQKMKNKHLNQDLIVTAQLNNALLWFKHNQQGQHVNYEVIQLNRNEPEDNGCHTPHLVRAVPHSNIVVTSCRATNPGDIKSNYKSKITLVNLESGSIKQIAAGSGVEGLAVTEQGDIWAGSLRDNTVSVYHLNNFDDVNSVTTVAKYNVFQPLRIAFESTSNRIAVTSFYNENHNFYVFDAKSRKQIHKTVIKNHAGVISQMEGLTGAAGYFITGGFNNQTMFIIDAASGKLSAEVQMPVCSLPQAFAKPIEIISPESAMSSKAKEKHYAGWNNWSGGWCQATMRSPYDRRFSVLDGFAWLPPDFD